MASTKKLGRLSSSHKQAKRKKVDSILIPTAKDLSEDEEALEKLVFGEDFFSETLAEDKGAVEVDELPQNVKRHVDKKPAWHDHDDDNLHIEDKLKQYKKHNERMSKKKHERLDEHVQKVFLEKTGTPKWAELRIDTLQDSRDKDLLQVTGDLIAPSKTLHPGTIDIRKCRDLTYEARNKNIVKSVEFHSKAQVACVAGFSGTATLFQVDGKVNTKIQSIHFEDFPIHTAHFSVDGEQIIVGSKEQPYFYYYDMMSGKVVKIPATKGLDQKNVGQFELSPDGKLIAIMNKSGHINLITTKSKEWVGTLKMNGEVKALTFNKDGTKMYSHGEAGQVYIWDLGSRRCLHKWTDEGCISGTSIALSPNEQYFATGSDVGVVNIYDNLQLSSVTNPKPMKTFMNLTTGVTSLKFNHTSEILCMASMYKDNAVKIAHFPSMTVFSNFPIFSQNFSKPNCLDISLHSGYFTFGNNSGNAYLFRLKHYGNY